MTSQGDWPGTWRNQYDSEVEITDDADGRIAGVFRTAIESSPFFGIEAPITGTCAGSTIAFVCSVNAGAEVEAGDGVTVSYTGQLDGDRLETLWLVVDGGSDWWRSVLINHDTFERVPSPA